LIGSAFKENDMLRYTLIALAAIATPAMTLAQVGPNPAVNGSLDPTVGSGGDRVTAPEDVKVGPAGPESTLPDRAADNAADAAVNATDPAAAGNTATAPAASEKAVTQKPKRKPR
jgi:hypothetical protein